MAEAAGTAAFELAELRQGANNRRGFEPRGSVGTRVQGDRDRALTFDLRVERSPLQELGAGRVLEGPIDVMSMAETDGGDRSARAREAQAIGGGHGGARGGACDRPSRAMGAQVQHPDASSADPTSDIFPQTSVDPADQNVDRS